MAICGNRDDETAVCSDARSGRKCLCAIELKAELLLADARDLVETRQARVPDSARETA